MTEQARQLNLGHHVDAGLVVPGRHPEVTSAYVYTQEDGLSLLNVDHHIVENSQPDADRTVFTLPKAWEETVFDLALGKATVIGFVAKGGEEVRLNPVYDTFEPDVMNKPFGTWSNETTPKR